MLRWTTDRGRSFILGIEVTFVTVGWLPDGDLLDGFGPAMAQHY